MVDKELLKVSDPRDAFALMLLERIDALENRIYQIEKRLEKVEDISNRTDKDLANLMEFRVQRINNYSCYGSVSSSFFVKIVKPITMTNQDFKDLCVDVLNKIRQKLGADTFMTLTVVIGSRDGTTTAADVYINMKDKCFIYLIFRLLSTIQYPFPVNAKCDMIDLYLLHINHGNIGDYYSLYDVNGKAIEFPEWKEWRDSLELCILESERR